MLPEPVIDGQVAGQPVVPFLGVLERHGVGPLAAERLDESLRLAVGSGRVAAPWLRHLETTIWRPWPELWTVGAALAHWWEPLSEAVPHHGG